MPPRDSAADAEFIVPPARIFVLGDNRNNSVGSRKFGFVPLADLIGKARQIWFSWSNGPRWARIGAEIE
ncbi:signal peptidase I [Rhodoblastus acidophilus]|nr:S26 family signal peptidase [Rhodoblastus acidophilus]MCW2283754.1 signal peptidase I [Rhodoblastus acidophilus]MCW2332897.1 signal peptidase I [Rhodoblastus acidophilus]